MANNTGWYFGKTDWDTNPIAPASPASHVTYNTVKGDDWKDFVPGGTWGPDTPSSRTNVSMLDTPFEERGTVLDGVAVARVGDAYTGPNPIDIDSPPTPTTFTSDPFTLLGDVDNDIDPNIYTSTYEGGDVTSQQTVEDWYKNIFGREGKKEGIDYWKSAIDDYGSREQVYDIFRTAGGENLEDLGIWLDETAGQSVFDLSTIAGGYQTGVADPGAFTGTTWEEKAAWDLDVSAYEADQLKGLKPGKTEAEIALEAQLVDLQAQIDELKGTTTVDDSTIDPITGLSTVTTQPEFVSDTRDQYYTNILRNDPTTFRSMLDRAEGTDSELYQRLLNIANTVELSTRESEILKNDQLRGRVDYLKDLKNKQPEVYLAILDIMEAKNKDLYDALIGIIQDESSLEGVL